MTVTHPIPDAALANHIAILGKTGSGKTIAAKGMVERILDCGERVCAIDPTGVWHGLRSSASGKRAGYPVVIFGGPHGDVPLGQGHGEAIAEIVGESSTSAVIDTSQMRVSERTRFFADFGDALVRKNRGPLHLVIDECHVFMPQGRVSDPSSGQMLHAANNMVSLGRSRGLRITLISQRPAKVHKDALTQVETLVAMRLIAPQDRRAVEDWIADNADSSTGKEVVASLATLKTGEAWLWAPELGVLERVKFPMSKTFDSSRAPDGAGGTGPVLAPIDLAAVNARLKTVVDEAKANDPKSLKAEIARLKADLQKSAENMQKLCADPSAIAEAEQRGFARGHASAMLAMREADTAIGRLIDGMVALRERMQSVAEHIGVVVRSTGDARHVTQSNPKSSKADQPNDDRRPIGAERRPLAVLAAVYPGGMTEAQWAVAAGLKRTGGTWSTYLSRLRTGGYIARDGDMYAASDSGIAALGDDVPTMPPPGPELVTFWADRLSGAGRLLFLLADEYPEWTTRERLAETAGITATGGTFSTYLSRLRTPRLIEEGAGGRLRLAPALIG